MSVLCCTANKWLRINAGLRSIAIVYATLTKLIMSQAVSGSYDFS